MTVALKPNVIIAKPMTPTGETSNRQLLNRVLLAALFIVLALAVLTQTSPGIETPNRDYGFYAYIGKQIAKGYLPYRDVWESKPPAIFYLNAFALRLGRGSRWGIWLVEFAFLFSAIAASYHLIKKLWGLLPAIFGVIIWLWGIDFTLQGGNYTEEYPLVLHFLALILLLRLIQTPKHRLFNLTLGLTLSISLLFRPNNAVVEIVSILVFSASLLWKRDFKSFFIAVSWVTLGIAIPLAITSAYFAHHGLFQAMLEASILYNLAYSQAERSATSPLTVGFEYLNLAAWIGLTGYLLILARIKDILKSPHLPLFIVLLIGTPAAVFLSDPAKRNYGHYFMNWLPFIAPLSAFAFHTIQQKLFPPSAPRLPLSAFRLPPSAFRFLPSFLFPLSSFIIALLFLLLSGRASLNYKAFDRLLTSAERELRSPISIYVENHTNPGEYVLFWATHPGENLMSHRDAPYSTLFYPNLVDSEIADRLNDDFFADLQRNRPVLIVDMGRLTIPSLDPAKREEQKAAGVYPTNPPDNLDEVLKFIEDNYYLEAVIKDKPVYRLRGTGE
ncbi:MAG: glycosyltransferase family 39 protein [Chloroflexi bacterium]|nr:glycosyltransferase family 39 protein [Chloroflexota bacterium]